MIYRNTVTQTNNFGVHLWGGSNITVERNNIYDMWSDEGNDDVDGAALRLPKMSSVLVNVPFARHQPSPLKAGAHHGRMIGRALATDYLGLTNTFALLHLLAKSDSYKDIEILALRHQIGVLQRQLSGTRVKFSPIDRALLAALLNRLPCQTLHRLRLLVRPDTILRWHRDILRRRHAKASRPKRPGRPRTIRSIRILVLCPRSRRRQTPCRAGRSRRGGCCRPVLSATTKWPPALAPQAVRWQPFR